MKTFLTAQAICEIEPRQLVKLVIELCEMDRKRDSTKLLAEMTVGLFAKRRREEYVQHDIREEIHGNDSCKHLELPLVDISVVTACMNRGHHLVEALASWISTKRFKEIIVVDYGSLVPIENALRKEGFLDKSNVRIVRVERTRWHLAEAFNIGLEEAMSQYILKLDSDTVIQRTADRSLSLSESQFKTGNWRTFRDRHLNGIVLAPREAVRYIGGYNEHITHYGYEDCDFYERLHRCIPYRSDLEEEDFLSIQHSDEERLVGSREDRPNADIQDLIEENRILAGILPRWGRKSLEDYQHIDGSTINAKNIELIREVARDLALIQKNYTRTSAADYSYNMMMKDLCRALGK